MGTEPRVWYTHFMNTSTLDYLIKITYDRAYKGYVADVLNLYGCMSQGKTKTEALKNAHKAIKAYMYTVTQEVKESEVMIEQLKTPFAFA